MKESFQLKEPRVAPQQPPASSESTSCPPQPPRLILSAASAPRDQPQLEIRSPALCVTARVSTLTRTEQPRVSWLRRGTSPKGTERASSSARKIRSASERLTFARSAQARLIQKLAHQLARDVPQEVTTMRPIVLVSTALAELLRQQEGSALTSVRGAKWVFIALLLDLRPALPVKLASTPILSRQSASTAPLGRYPASPRLHAPLAKPESTPLARLIRNAKRATLASTRTLSSPNASTAPLVRYLALVHRFVPSARMENMPRARVTLSVSSATMRIC